MHVRTPVFVSNTEAKIKAAISAAGVKCTAFKLFADYSLSQLYGGCTKASTGVALWCCEGPKWCYGGCTISDRGPPRDNCGNSWGDRYRGTGAQRLCRCRERTTTTGVWS